MGKGWVCTRCPGATGLGNCRAARAVLCSAPGATPARCSAGPRAAPPWPPVACGRGPRPFPSAPSGHPSPFGCRARPAMPWARGSRSVSSRRQSTRHFNPWPLRAAVLQNHCFWRYAQPALLPGLAAGSNLAGEILRARPRGSASTSRRDPPNFVLMILIRFFDLVSLCRCSGRRPP